MGIMDWLFGGPEETKTETVTNTSGTTRGGSTGRTSYDPFITRATRGIVGSMPGAMRNAGRFDSYLENLAKTPAYSGASRQYLEGQPFGLGQAQPYMDMYVDAVQPALSEIDRTMQGTIGDLGDSFGGAYGGSKYALAEDNLIEDSARLKSNILADASIGGLNFGANRFDADRAGRFAAENALQSASGLASGQNQQAFGNLFGLGNAGLNRLGTGAGILSTLPKNVSTMGDQWGESTSTGTQNSTSVKEGGGGGFLGNLVGIGATALGTGLFGSPAIGASLLGGAGSPATGVFSWLN